MPASAAALFAAPASHLIALERKADRQAEAGRVVHYRCSPPIALRDRDGAARLEHYRQRVALRKER